MANQGAAAYLETHCDGCRSVSERCTQTCSGCKIKRYCSRECQVRAWDLHIFECDAPGKEIKSYNLLVRAIQKDEIPTDPRLREQFGFNRANLSPEVGCDGSQRLFGLYVGLTKTTEVRAKTLDNWRKRGILLQEIKKVYETEEAEFRGQYYLGFLGTNSFWTPLSPSQGRVTTRRVWHPLKRGRRPHQPYGPHCISYSDCFPSSPSITYCIRCHNLSRSQPLPINFIPFSEYR
jgi:hypothetical protein